MNEYDEVKSRVKLKKHNKYVNEEKKDNYVNNLITRLIMALIVFFGVIIATNFNSVARLFVRNKVLKDNMSFTKISNIYNKYLGNVLPIKDVGSETATVFNEKVTYKSIVNYKDGYEASVDENYLVPIINSGIVVFIGEKENYGHTVIIEGIDEVEYWYGGLENISVSLYDYASKGNLLGNTASDKLYLVFKKDGEYLDYEEVMD